MNTIRALCAATLLTMTAPAGASIEIYDVDPAYRQEVYEILSQMLGTSPVPELNGRVQLLPSGQLLVDTNRDERQAEVARVLEAIATSEPTETPMITLRYWILHGVPGGSNAAGFPTILAPVVRELEAVHGPLGLEVIDAASVAAITDEAGTLTNDRWQIWQHATATGDRVNAQLQLDHELQDLSMQLSLTRGEFVVLGAGTSGQIVDGGVVALVVNWPDE